MKKIALIASKVSYFTGDNKYVTDADKIEILLRYNTCLNKYIKLEYEEININENDEQLLLEAINDKNDENSASISRRR